MLEKRHKLCVFFIDHIWSMLSIKDTSYARKKTQAMCLFYRPYMVDALNKRHKLCSKKDTSYT